MTDAVARGITVGIIDIKEGAVPGGENRIAARRHHDIVGDQLFNAGALRIPDDTAVHHWKFGCTLAFQTPMPSEAQSLFGTSGSNTIFPSGHVGAGGGQPGHVGGTELSAPVDPAPCGAAIKALIQIAGGGGRRPCGLD